MTSGGVGANMTVLAIIFKPAQAAEKSWRRLGGHNRLPKLIQGVRFVTVFKPPDNSIKPPTDPSDTKVQR